MKANLFIGVVAVSLIANAAIGQDIPQSQVPSVIVNNFQQTFPNAFDVEWEMEGDVYEVDFETGLTGTDHSAWFDRAGSLTGHKEEISKSDLPEKVLTKLGKDFIGYRIDDAKKITRGDRLTFKVELESSGEEWKVVIDAGGNVLSKVVD